MAVDENQHPITQLEEEKTKNTSLSTTPSGTFSTPATISGGPKSKKKWVIAAMSIIILALVGLGAWYVLYFNNPDKVLRDAANHVVKADKSTFGGEFTIAQAKDKAKPVARVAFDGQGTSKSAEVNAKATISVGAADINIEASALSMADQTLYVKLKNAKQLADLATTSSSAAPFAPQLQTIAKTIDNKWIKVSKDQLESLGAIETGCEGGTFSLSTLSKNDQQKISDLFGKHPFAKVDKKLADEKINGKSSFHYKLGFDKNEATKFGNELKNIESFKKLEKCFGSQEQSDSKSVSDDVRNTNVEVWVDKKSHQPTKLAASFDSEDASFAASTTLDLTRGQEPSAPSDAMSVDQLTKQLQSQLLLPGTIQ